VSLKKILIIRFSSIGDIVLTTPVIRCLKKQHKYCIHYLTKSKYIELLKFNPYIDKFYSINSNINEIINDLKKEKYDYVIDLHNNIRSFVLKKKLNIISDTVYKESFEKWLYINTGINLIKNKHVVNRYFKTFKKININDDGKGIDYFIDPSINAIPHLSGIKFNQTQYIIWILGGTYSNKRLSKKNVLNICKNIDFPIIFLGGEEEVSVGDYVVKSHSAANNRYNLCGKLTFDQSAWLIKKSKLVLSNDTGFMHVSAAFQKKIISFWGCTKPILGMSPYISDEKSIMFIGNPNKRPCSKLGDKCLYSKDGCVNDIDVEYASNIIMKQLFD